MEGDQRRAVRGAQRADQGVCGGRDRVVDLAVQGYWYPGDDPREARQQVEHGVWRQDQEEEEACARVLGNGRVSMTVIHRSLGDRAVAGLTRRSTETTKHFQPVLDWITNTFPEAVPTYPP